MIPLSLNHYQKVTVRGRFPSFYKPKESIKYDSQINSALNSHKSIFTKLNKVFDSSKHYLEIDYEWFMPVFTKKKDRISKKSKDCDNLIKPLQDLMFKRLNADDSEIISVKSTKIHSENYEIIVVIRLRNINEIR